MSLGTFDYRAIDTNQLLLQPANGVAAVALTPADTKQRRIDRLMVGTDDVINHVVLVLIHTATATYSIGTFTVLAGAGHGAVAMTEGVLAMWPTGDPGVQLGAGCQLQVQLEVAVGAGHVMQLTSLGGTF